MTPMRIDVDFIPQRKKISVPGFLVLTLGLFVAVWVYDDYTSASVSSEILKMKLDRQLTRTTERPSGTPLPGADEVALAQQHLLTPWSRLLVDLESAAADSKKDVALLELAPDRSKRRLRISGEARSLVHVLQYVERLQQAESLAAPLLESHEIQTANKERQVRFVVTAVWRVDG